MIESWLFLISLEIFIEDVLKTMTVRTQLDTYAKIGKWKIIACV